MAYSSDLIGVNMRRMTSGSKERRYASTSRFKEKNTGISPKGTPNRTILKAIQSP